MQKGMSALPPKADIGLLLLALFLPPIIPLIGAFRMSALPRKRSLAGATGMSAKGQYRTLRLCDHFVTRF